MYWQCPSPGKLGYDAPRLREQTGATIRYDGNLALSGYPNVRFGRADRAVGREGLEKKWQIELFSVL